MIIHETHLRCPHCNESTFFKKEKILLNKAYYESTKKAMELDSKVHYICSNCGRALKTKN